MADIVCRSRAVFWGLAAVEFSLLALLPAGGLRPSPPTKFLLGCFFGRCRLRIKQVSVRLGLLLRPCLLAFCRLPGFAPELLPALAGLPAACLLLAGLLGWLSVCFGCIVLVVAGLLAGQLAHWIGVRKQAHNPAWQDTHTHQHISTCETTQENK